MDRIADLLGRLPGSEPMPIAGGDMLARLLVAAVLGAAIGFERELRARPAGLRTHMLVALAACSFALISAAIFEAAVAAGGRPDPLRMVDAATAGVAFLAAGAIIRGEQGIRGLTTGAAMWLAGAIGIASGAGYFFLAGMATVLALVILSVLRLFEP